MGDTVYTLVSVVSIPGVPLSVNSELSNIFQQNTAKAYQKRSKKENSLMKSQPLETLKLQLWSEFAEFCLVSSKQQNQRKYWSPEDRSPR